MVDLHSLQTFSGLFVFLALISLLNRWLTLGCLFVVEKGVNRMLHRVPILVLTVGAVAMAALIPIGSASPTDAQTPAPTATSTVPKACGNITVAVKVNTPTALCPGGPVFTITDTIVKGTQPTANHAVTADLTPEACEHDQGFTTVLLAGGTFANVKTSEEFNLQPFSNIDPGYSNPPFMQEDTTNAGYAVGYRAGTPSGYTNVSQWFNSAAIAQIKTHADFPVSWTPQVIPDPLGLAEVDYTFSIDFYSNSPGYASPICPSASYTISEHDIPLATVAGVADAIGDAIAWSWDQTIRGLCGLFGC